MRRTQGGRLGGSTCVRVDGCVITDHPPARSTCAQERKDERGLTAGEAGGAESGEESDEGWMVGIAPRFRFLHGLTCLSSVPHRKICHGVELGQVEFVSCPNPNPNPSPYPYPSSIPDSNLTPSEPNP